MTKRAACPPPRWHDRVGDAAKIILARSQIAGRQLVGIRWDHPVRLLDFTGFGMKPLAELVIDGRVDDIFLCDASQYGSTQQWATWFRSTYPDAAGFRWMSRQHNSSYCYVFFDDACRDFKLTITEAAEPLEGGTHAFRLLQSSSACWRGRSSLECQFRRHANERNMLFQFIQTRMSAAITVAAF
jgi:RES domain